MQKNRIRQYLICMIMLVSSEFLEPYPRRDIYANISSLVVQILGIERILVKRGLKIKSEQMHGAPAIETSMSPF